MFGHQQAGVSANEPSPAERKIPLPQPIRAACCCLWLGSTGTGSLQGQETGERVLLKWGQQDCSRFIAPLKNLIAKISSCLLKYFVLVLKFTAQACCLLHIVAAGWPSTGASTLKRDDL